MNQDCLVKQDGARLRLEKGEFEKFTVWKAGPKIGEIAAKQSGFAVLNDAGQEIEMLAGLTVEGKGDKAGANKDLELLQGLPCLSRVSLPRSCAVRSAQY